MKLVAKAGAFFDGTLNVLAIITEIILAFLMLLVCVEVASRYFLNRPMIWVIEITQYGLVFITFLATAWVLKNEGHVVLDFVVTRLRPKAQNLVNFITSFLAAVVCIIVAWYGVKVWWDYLQIQYVYHGSLRIPAHFLEVVIPIGSFLLFVQFLRRAYGYLKKTRPS